MKHISKIFFLLYICYLFIPTNAFSLSWDDPNVNPVQSISDQRWRDANTGRFITPPTVEPTQPTTPTTSPTPTTAPTPSTPTTTPTTPAQPVAPTQQQKPSQPQNTTKTSAKAAVAKGAMGAVGLATGTIGLINSVSGNQAHTWGDVAQGAISGATAAAGGAAIINAIPVIGNISYGITVAGGAILGGLIAGSQLFSETDCLTDPVTGLFTCCNTEFNKGERQVEIGGYMFCGSETPETNGTQIVQVQAQVRQCLQGGQPTKAEKWWQRPFKDDSWAPICVERFCDENNKPVAGIENYITYVPDKTNVCWNWNCIDGYVKQGNTCTLNGNPVTPDKLKDYNYWINLLQQTAKSIRQACSDVMQINQGTL